MRLLGWLLGDRDLVRRVHAMAADDSPEGWHIRRMLWALWFGIDIGEYPGRADD